MPSTVNTSFLSEVVNKLLSFNLAPESFHIPDIFYLLLFIHSGEHRFTLDSRHVYVRFCLLTNSLSSRTFSNFSQGYPFFLILPKSRYHHIEIVPYLWKFLTFHL